jgi:hypothetical protein
MHECPECGFVCDCDGDDLWSDLSAKECTCCEMGNAGDVLVLPHMSGATEKHAQAHSAECGGQPAGSGCVCGVGFAAAPSPSEQPAAGAPATPEGRHG